MHGHRLGSTVTIALLALALVAAGTVAATATVDGPVRASDHDTTASAELGASIVSVSQGATTQLAVNLDDTRRATVVVGGPQTGYNITVTVTDANGDGTVPLEFRTDSVGMQATRFRPADDGDDYGTLNASPDPDGTVPAGEYPLAVYVGHGVRGEPTDVGTLVVTEPSPPPNASLDGAGSTITLHPLAAQPVSGTTELAAGREVTVRLRSTGQNPFLKSRTTTVSEDGTFTARFDLSGIAAPAEATVTVLVDGRQIAGPAEVEIESSSTATTPKPSETTTTPGQPGFGPAVAVVALLGAFALGRSIRD